LEEDVDEEGERRRLIGLGRRDDDVAPVLEVSLLLLLGRTSLLACCFK
jgi:hypothetical protein